MRPNQEAFKAYKIYLALKQHFTRESYDYFKYNGKVRANIDSFDKRKDKWFFYKLSKQPDYHQLILANLIKDPNIWVGSLLNDDVCTERFNAWKKRNQALTYHFKKDLKMLNEDFDSNILVNDGQFPQLLKLYQQGNIELETIIILNDIFNFLPYWNKKIVDRIIFDDINKIIKKYSPFLDYDKKKIKRILLDTFKHNTN